MSGTSEMYSQVFQQCTGYNESAEDEEKNPHYPVDPEFDFRITEHLDFIGKNAFQDISSKDHSQSPGKEHGNRFPVAAIGGVDRNDPENPKKPKSRICHIQEKTFEVIGNNARPFHVDLTNDFHLFAFRDFTKNRKEPIRYHNYPTQDSECQVKFRSCNELGNTEKGENNEKQVTGKNSKCQEYPGFYSVFNTGLKECNQGRAQCYRDRQTEDQSFEKGM